MGDACLVCLRPLGDLPGVDTHRRCVRRLFGTSRMPRIEVDAADLRLMGLEMVGRETISGVQRKLALGLQHNVLRVGTGESSYILKPQESGFSHLPENEHLSLHLAGLIGLPTPDFGLVRLSDRSLALLVKRFDRLQGRRLAMEDLCQLAGLLPGDKYNGSAELCVRLVRQYSAEPLADVALLFRQFLLSWWIGNGDLHLKNLSLLTGTELLAKISPVYDLVNTRILIPGDQLALPLSGKRDRLKPQDWLKFAEYCNLPPAVVEQEIRRFHRAHAQAKELLDRSHLPIAQRLQYLQVLEERWPVLDEVGRRASELLERKVPLGPTEFMTSKSAEVAQQLRASFEEQGVDLSKTPLAGDLKDVEWLANLATPIFEEHGAARTDAERTWSAITKTLRYDRIRRSLNRCREMAGFDGVLKHVKNIRAPHGASTDTQAWDSLFEIELAAQLRSRHWKLEFRDTDIVLVDGEGTTLGFECKRPRTVATIVKNVQSGCDQLARRDMLGVVAISVDLLQPAWLASLDGVPDQAKYEGHVSRIVKDVRADVEQRLAAFAVHIDAEKQSGVLGVMFCATLLVAARPTEGGGLLQTRFVGIPVVNPVGREFLPLLEFYRNVLVVGDRELMASA